jgi:uncharacterized membrane protein HdeD (DUF308 family)
MGGPCFRYCGYHPTFAKVSARRSPLFEEGYFLSIMVVSALLEETIMLAVSFARALPRWLRLALAVTFLVFGALFLLFRSQDTASEIFRGFGLVWLIIWIVVLARILTRAKRFRQIKMILAIFACVAGVMAVILPTLTAVVALSTTYFFLAGTAIAVGIVTLYDAVPDTRDPAARKWMRIGLGVLEILVGFFFFVNPIFIPGIMIPVLGIVLLAAGAFLGFVALETRLPLSARLR